MRSSASAVDDAFWQDIFPVGWEKDQFMKSCTSNFKIKRQIITEIANITSLSWLVLALENTSQEKLS